MMGRTRQHSQCLWPMEWVSMEWLSMKWMNYYCASVQICYPTSIPEDYVQPSVTYLFVLS